MILLSLSHFLECHCFLTWVCLSVRDLTGIFFFILTPVFAPGSFRPGSFRSISGLSIFGLGRFGQASASGWDVSGKVHKYEDMLYIYGRAFGLVILLQPGKSSSIS